MFVVAPLWLILLILLCVAVGVVIAALGPALADELMSFQGYRVCSGPGGDTSTEWRWQGMTIGQDNQGHRWTTSRWMGVDATTIEPRR